MAGLFLGPILWLSFLGLSLKMGSIADPIKGAVLALALWFSICCTERGKHTFEATSIMFLFYFICYLYFLLTIGLSVLLLLTTLCALYFFFVNILIFNLVFSLLLSTFSLFFPLDVPFAFIYVKHI